MRQLTHLFEPKTIVHAHCDLPCGVYDPRTRIEAESVRAIAEMYAQNTDPEFRARAIFIKDNAPSWSGTTSGCCGRLPQAAAL